METAKVIIVDGESPLFDTQGMFYKSFQSDFRQIRYFTLLVAQKAPREVKEINLLEQQISELIKNAVKHGNHCDPKKNVEVWFSFSEMSARLIVRDQGEGFKRLDEWNLFNRKRNRCFQEGDFEGMADLVSFVTDESDENDGGNALFAALEYWDGGVVFNDAHNSVAVAKTFQARRHGIAMDDGEEED